MPVLMWMEAVMGAVSLATQETHVTRVRIQK